MTIQNRYTGRTQRVDLRVVRQFRFSTLNGLLGASVTFALWGVQVQVSATGSTPKELASNLLAQVALEAPMCAIYAQI